MNTISNSPWGKPDSVQSHGEGVWFVSTPSHGGFAVRADLLSKIKPEWVAYARKWAGAPFVQYGWFEEDCCWAAVALTWPERFKPADVEMARKIVQYFDLA